MSKINYKIVPLDVPNISGKAPEFLKTWRLSKRLWGEVVLRDPKVMDDELELALYGMSDEIGGFSPSTKETFINLIRMKEEFGPFTDQDYDVFKLIFFERSKNIDEKHSIAVRELIDELDIKIHAGQMSKSEAAQLLFVQMIMGHEMGHHKIIPYDLKKALILNEAAFKITNDREIGDYIANVYEDIIINFKLAKTNSLPIEMLYTKMTEKLDKITPSWQFYMRIYENLLNVKILPHNVTDSGEMKLDIEQAVRLIKSSNPSNYLHKLKEFTSIFKKYIDQDSMKNPRPLDKQIKPNIGPDQPGRKRAAQNEAKGLAVKQKEEAETGDKPNIQIRDLQEYQNMMIAAGIALNAKEATVMYYKDLASRFCVQFPLYPKMTGDEVMEGVELWNPAEHEIQDLDLPLTLQMGPVIPGVTTVRRTKTEGYDVRASFEMPDLVAYVDASGSRPNPNEELSYPVLGATIWIQSAINVGAKARVVVFDSRTKFEAMTKFTRDIDEAMEYVLTYAPTEESTTFPLEDLKETHDNPECKKYPIRFVIISDAEPVKHIINDKLDGKPGEELLKQIQAERKKPGDFLLGDDNRMDSVTEEIEKLKGLGFRVYSMKDWSEIIKAASDSAESIYDPYRYLKKLEQGVQ